MKQGLHPTWYPDALVICACGNTWNTGATIKEIRTDICSKCHPFYTGEQRIVDTEGQVDRFMKRLQQREERLRVEEERRKPVTPDAVRLDTLDFKKQTLALLAAAGLETVDDVQRALRAEGDQGLLKLEGVGRQALSEVKRVLRGAEFELPTAEDAPAAE